MIDTELPGDSVICIVDRPVYGAHGGNILLPQGSRIVGSYQSLANVGVKRLPVAWKRFIRPDGASVTLSAPSAALDLMGRAGIPAKVDNRWLARYGAAFASAMLNTSIAFATAPSRGQSNSITGSINGSNIQNPVDQARTTAAQSLGAITQQLLAEGISLKPVARVQAGTRLIIRPSVDLIFPVPRRLRGDPRWGQIALAPSALGDVRAALVATGAAATRSSTQPKHAQPAPAPKIAPVVVENLPPDTVDPFSN